MNVEQLSQLFGGINNVVFTKQLRQLCYLQNS